MNKEQFKQGMHILIKYRGYSKHKAYVMMKIYIDRGLEHPNQLLNKELVTERGFY